MADTTTPGSLANLSSASPGTPLSSNWILGARRDLTLLIATPLLITPALMALHSGVAWEQIALVVAAFGATGHHLPGMLRAYGDRALFRKFRIRFIVAPIFLVGASIYSSLQGFGGIFFVVSAWGLWHAMMQTYGIARIYDAKVSAFSRRASRMDWLLCVAWFGAGSLLSPVRMGKLLSYFYEAGGFFVEPQMLHAVQTVWMVGTLAFTIVYGFHLVALRRTGQPFSWLKLLVLAISCSFWWYTTVAVSHMLVGIALWEICHDIQYLTIVWVFNRSRAKRDPDVGAFTRFIFGRSSALAGAYVGLVFGYGVFGWVGLKDFGAPINSVLEGLLIASGLLHFYFDGFIWKVRDRSIGSPLDLRQDASQASWHNATWPRHLAAWATLVFPIVILDAQQRSSISPEVEQLNAVIGAVPDYSDAYDRRGLALFRERRVDEAKQDFETTIRQQPDHAKARVNLLLLEAKGQDPQEKIPLYREALTISPNDPRTHQLIASAYRVTGNAKSALQHYERALQISPDFPRAHFGFARLLIQQGELESAELHLETALRVDPDDQRFRSTLERVRARLSNR